jgi:hypothetical protein
MEILSQTENFFVMHVSSLDDIKALKNAKIAFEGAVSDVLLTEPVIGLAKVYSEPFQPLCPRVSGRRVSPKNSI